MVATGWECKLRLSNAGLACANPAYISSGRGHELRYVNGTFEHCLRDAGLLFIDVHHHKNDALCNVWFIRLFGRIGGCPEKPTGKAAAGRADKDHASRRSDRINAGGSKSAQADQQTSRRAKGGTARTAQGSADFVIVRSDDADLFVRNSCRLKRGNGAPRLVVGIEKLADCSHLTAHSTDVARRSFRSGGLLLPPVRVTE
ncbi:hypothetical protein IQ26_06461 [Mesorhizobium tianshanense]|uniref:Uncharacterized protein n=1 Tax=Mesorhizobium tianshanense TaxID=39844 RepID=A0A562MTA1_9HYPH|nr:hypothetical protein IQ26_06461 [Mesorhizobium tianshanense]